MAGAEGRLAAHVWRAATAGNLGGWMVARALFFLTVLTGSVGTVGGHQPQRMEQVHPARPEHAERPRPVEREALAAGVPAVDQRDVDPAAAPAEGGARQARGLLLPGLQPDLDQPRRLHLDRGPHRREPGRPARRPDADLVGDRRCSPTTSCPWGTAPSGTTRSRTRQYGGKWIGFRQPVRRVAMERLGTPVSDSRESNPGEVWEENEFWFELSWRIDPDGSLGIRQYFESPDRPGREGDGRRLLRLGLRQPGARAAGEGGPAAGPDAAGVHAQATASSSSGTDMYRLDERPLTDAELDGATRRPAGRAAQAHDARLDPTPGGRGRCRRASSWRTARRSPAGSRRPATGALLADHGRLRLAGVRDAGLHRVARRAPRARPLPRRAGPDADLPAAHDDPHPLGQREVPQRDLQHPPALDEHRGRRTARLRDR